MEAISGRRFVLALGAVALLLGFVSYFSITRFHASNRQRAERQAAWPKIRTVRGREMVLVPAGVFLAGSRQEPVNTPAFYIDRQRVSREAFADFLKETGRPVTDEAASAEDARAFCAWGGQRLPYSVEWEKAARVNAVPGLHGDGWEWIDDSLKAGSGDIAAFERLHRMEPPLRPEEKWTRVRGGTPPADSSMFPSRFRDAAIGFRCVWLPPQ